MIMRSNQKQIMKNLQFRIETRYYRIRFYSYQELSPHDPPPHRLSMAV